MKTLRKILFVLITLFLTPLIFSCNSTNKTEYVKFQIAYEKVWLDRYEEKMVEFTNEVDVSKLSFESQDTNVVTIENGKLIAMGVGETKVTVSNGNNSQSFTVKVNDSGVEPVISFDNFDIYEGYSIDIPLYVDYNASLYKVNEYKATLANTAVASIEGNTIKGLVVGETSKLFVEFTYKGLEYSKVVKVTVKEGSLVYFEKESYDVYCAEGNKLGKVVLEPIVVFQGNKLESPNVTYKVTSGENNVALENNVVYGKQEGQAIVEATYEVEGKKVSGSTTINIKPNYIETHFVNSSSYKVKYEPYSGAPIAGRSENLMEYKVEEDYFYWNEEKGKWALHDLGISYWEYRINAEDSAYTYADIYRKGYRYFAYDLYYDSGENFYMGLDKLGPVSINVGTYFRHDGIQIFSDGVMTNRIEKNKWITISFDLYYFALNHSTNNVGFFFTINDSRKSCFLTNIRYYLDDNFLPDENRYFIEKDGYVEASNDEFDVMVPCSNGFSDIYGTGARINENEVPTYKPYEGSVAGRENVYEYKTFKEDSWNNSLILASSMGKSYDNAFVNLTKYGNDFTFDFYVENSSDIKFSINHTKLSALVKVGGKSNLIMYSSWLSILNKDGEAVLQIQPKQWYKAVLKIRDNYDLNSIKGCGASVIFSTATKDAVIYIDNLRFYKHRDYIKKDLDVQSVPKEVVSGHDYMTVEFSNDEGFTDTIKYINTASDNPWAGIWFTEAVLPPNNPVSTYTGNYMRFDVYIASDNVTGLRYKNYYKVDNTGEAYVSDLPKGKNYIFDQDNNIVTNIEPYKWYTYFIPTDNNHNWGTVYFETLCSSSNPFDEEKPGIVYIKNILSSDDLGEYQSLFDNINYGRIADNLAVVNENMAIHKIEEGSFAGTYKYTNMAQNSVWNGVWFTDVVATNNNPNATYKSQYVKFDVYVDSTNIFGLRGKNYYKTDKTYEIYSSGSPKGMNYVFDASGNLLTNLKQKEWLTYYLPTDNNHSWGLVYIQTLSSSENAFSNANPGIVYLRNIEHVNDFGEHQAVIDALNNGKIIDNLAVTSDLMRIEKVESGEFASCYKYTNSAANNAWTGVFFTDVVSTNNQPNGSYKNNYIKLQVYIDSDNIDGIRTKSYYKTDYNVNMYVSKDSDTGALLFNSSNEQVTRLTSKEWYTIYINTKYQENPNWGLVYLQTLSSTSSSFSESNQGILYIKNIEYKNAVA